MNGPRSSTTAAPEEADAPSTVPLRRANLSTQSTPPMGHFSLVLADHWPLVGPVTTKESVESTMSVAPSNTYFPSF